MTVLEPRRPTTLGPQPSKPLRGCVITTYRHYKGKRLGPYYFRKWKVGGKVHKEYIKPIPSPVDGRRLSRSDRVMVAVDQIRAECQRVNGRRKEIKRFVDNVTFLGNMCQRYDRGKEATPEQEAYIMRLHHEGHYIAGPRPPLRPRRVFGAPFFSNLLNFLPSGSKLHQIVREKGTSGFMKLLDNAKAAWQTSAYDQVTDTAIEECDLQDPPGWLQLS